MDVLAGIRVLDLTDHQHQYSGKMLADLGADVIKVEPPAGDPARMVPPFKHGEAHPEGSLYFAYLNANKRSLALDIGSPLGREVLAELAASADALIDSGALARTGISYAWLAAGNPGLVVTSIEGFDRQGLPGTDGTPALVSFALSGLMPGIGEPDGPPAGPPDELPSLAAVDAASGTLMALIARDATGRGQLVRVVEHQVLAAQLIPQNVQDAGRGRTGNLHRDLTPSGVYRCRDGAVEVTIVMPAQWTALCEWLGAPPDLAGPEWEDRALRRRHAERITGWLAEALSHRSQTDVVVQAQARRIPCLPVHTIAGFMADEHVRARGYFTAASHPVIGAHDLAGPPCRFGDSTFVCRRSAPLLGEDTVEILSRDLHCGPERIRDLEAAGVVACSGKPPRPFVLARPPAQAPRVRAQRQAGHDLGRGGDVEAERARRRESGDQPAVAARQLAGTLPLQGVRVVAFSTAYAGPTLSRYLADYGAEVIKIESRRRPDNTRYAGQAAAEPGGAMTSPSFGHFNRNKFGVSIDLSREEGREVVRRLIRRTDVVIENFSGRVMRGWGFDYESLRRVRPDIILLDMQGMGQTGPNSEFVTYGPGLHSYSGLTSAWGFSHASFVDFVAAQQGVVAVLAALLLRHRTGRGQHIDLAQFEAAAAMLGVAYLDSSVNGNSWQRRANQSFSMAPHGVYRCRGSNEWCAITVRSDDEWRRLARAANLPERRDLELMADRLRRPAEVDGVLESWTRQHSAADVERALRMIGIPASAVRAPADLPNDESLRAGGFFTHLEHPVLGRHQAVGLTIHLSETPGAVRRAAPLMGQDNEYVLREVAGFDAAEIRRLEAEGVLR